MNEAKNTGVIEVLPVEGDFISGAESAYPDGIDNPTSSWVKDEPPGEWQKDLKANFETDACVSFGANDELETLGDYLISNGIEYSQEDIQWLRDNGYFNSDGTLNFSDRFVAKVSGTSKSKGNSIPAVWKAIRHYGLVPETLWPFPMDEINADPTNAWQIYYKDIPQNVLDMGQEFLKRFEVLYEWVFMPGSVVNKDTVTKELRKSPLQIVTKVCWPWNVATPIQGCGVGVEHSTVLTGVTNDYEIFDHYAPFNKLFALDYSIPYAVRGIFIPRKVAPAQNTFAPFTQALIYGDTDSPAVHNMQSALQVLGYMKTGVFGPFGPQTKKALAAFQVSHGIQGDYGIHFGPKTRAAMQKAVDALNASPITYTHTSSTPNYSNNKPTMQTNTLQTILTSGNKILNWMLMSSANPQEASLTFKGLLLGMVPTAMIYIHATHISLSSAQLTYGINEAAIALQAVLMLMSVWMAVYGFVRKIALTVRGKNVKAS